MERAYHIKLQPEAEPFALSTPRRIALPLLPKVKQELERIEKMGVISKVNGPTDWCAGNGGCAQGCRECSNLC